MGFRQAQLHDAKALGALGRSTGLLPSQPALPHGGLTPSAAGSRNSDTATKGTAVQLKAGPEQPKPAPLQLPGYPAGPSAASSPVTPPASDVPLSASDSPASPPHTASKQPAQQQHLTGKAAPAATLAAAAVALSSTKHRLEGSLLLQQLMPLAARLGVAVGAGDLASMHHVLTLLQSVPMTGQLLFASQVARPVRSILQQQVQLQAQHRQQQELQLLEDVVGAAKQLVRRWKGLLAADVNVCDDYRMARAQQCARTQRKQRQRSRGGAAGDAAAQTEQPRKVTREVPPNTQHTAAAPQHKRTYSQWQREQQLSQEQQQQQQQVHSGRQGKQQKHGPGDVATPTDQQHQQQKQVHPGVPLLPPLPPGASAAAGCTGSLSRRSNSRFSLNALACSSGEDLPSLAGLGLDWDPPLPGSQQSLGAEAAAAADAALEGGGLAYGAGEAEGPWAEGDEAGVLLVEGRAAMGMQGIPGALLL